MFGLGKDKEFAANRALARNGLTAVEKLEIAKKAAACGCGRRQPYPYLNLKSVRICAYIFSHLGFWLFSTSARQPKSAKNSIFLSFLPVRAKAKSKLFFFKD